MSCMQHGMLAYDASGGEQGDVIFRWHTHLSGLSHNSDPNPHLYLQHDVHRFHATNVLMHDSLLLSTGMPTTIQCQHGCAR